MAIADGRILLVGSNDDVRAIARKGAVVHDMRGRTITPGFIDAHMHFVHVVLHRLGTDCRPDRAPNIAAIQNRISEVAKNTPAGAWIRAWGCDEMHLAEQRQPTRAELDAAAPNHPTVLMHKSMHQCVANTAALEASQIDDSTPNPPNGWIERDRRGKANGLLYETAGEMVDARARAALFRGQRDALVRAALAAQRDLFRLGITRLCDPAVSPAAEAFYETLLSQDAFALQVHALGTSSGGMFDPPDERISRALSKGALRFDGVKFFADGAAGAAMRLTLRELATSTLSVFRSVARERSIAPLRIARSSNTRLCRDGSLRTGALFYDERELLDRIQRSVELDLGVAVHAIGNDAIRQATDVYSKLDVASSADAHLRIEHVMFAEPRDLQRLATSSVTAVVQPRFVHDFGKLAHGSGLARLFSFVPVKELLRAGAVVAGGSDAPVTHPCVLSAIESAVTRRSLEGEVVAEEQAISPYEALGLYTTGAAKALRVATECGSLSAGKRADFVILDADPTGVSCTQISGIGVEQTWIGGRKVHDAAAPPA